MKRCPQCNRVETDDALAFCRRDGATLVSDSSPIDQEAGTVKLGSGSVPTKVVTGPLPHSTNANFNRATAATTVLPQPQTAYGDFSITIKRRPNPKALAVIGTAIVVIVVAVVVITVRTRSSGAAIRSIAVMPFVNASGNADLDYLSDGMTEMVIKRLSQLPNLEPSAH